MWSIVLLWGVIYLTGMLVCKIGMEKETSQLWKHLTGFFFLFFCQGIIFFVGQLAGWSFGKSRKYLIMFLVVVCLISSAVCRKELGRLLSGFRNFSWKKWEERRYWALGLWIFLGLVFVFVTSAAGNRSDAMAETVQRTILTDTMNRFHPFTGQPLELGVITSKKLITLPFWYSCLGIWSGFDATTVVWTLGSLCTTVFSMLAFGELAGLLFYRNFRKTWLLIVLLELMYLSGDYYIGAAGYRQLHYGYSGEVMVATVWLPGMFCILYRFFGTVLRNDFPKEREGLNLWGMLLELGLCMGSSIFLTSFGWGFCLLLVAMILFFLCMAAARLFKQGRKKGVEKV